ncbi:MAG: glutamyl-tRNA reductase [Armatimonadetes bacterium]|nr:glutamyl-tRNA reductase [Armatimonadota bacterium]
MTVHLLALDYRRLPPAMRAQGLLPEAEAPRLLGRLAAGTAAAEVVLLATCHRCEVYAVTGAPDRLGAEVKAVLPIPVPAGQWRHLWGAEAIGHLCRVACGLDSSLVGEAQILGQVRRAWQEAAAAGTVGRILHRLFHLAVSAGKRARPLLGTDGRLTSLADLAVRLVAEQVDPLAGRRALVVGAGAMARAAVQSLLAAGVSEVVVAARHPEAAAALGARVAVAPLDRLTEVLAGVEVGLTATTAPGYLLDASAVRRVMAGRSRPLTLVDIAVPPDIDPEVRGIAGITLIDAETIAERARQMAPQPAETLARVEAVAASTAAAFDRWGRARAVVPAIVRLRRRAEEIQHAELARALRRLPQLDARERAVVTAMAAAIVNRLLHTPTARLTAEAGQGNGEPLRRALETLFALDQEEN